MLTILAMLAVGAAQTHMAIDPNEDLGFVLLTQVLPDPSCMPRWRREVMVMVQACVDD